MTCDRYRKLLSLYRTGELSNREAEELVLHLHSCERCRKEREQIVDAEIVIQKIRSFNPVLADPARMASSIVSKIRPATTDVHARGYLEDLLDLFALPQVRIGTAALILAAICTFLFQYLTFFNEVHTLEVAARTVSSPTGSHDVYAIRSSRLEDLARSRTLQPYLRPGSVKIKDGEVVVNKSDFGSFVSSYRFQSVASTIVATMLHMDERMLNQFVDHIAANTRSFPASHF